MFSRKMDEDSSSSGKRQRQTTRVAHSTSEALRTGIEGLRLSSDTKKMFRTRVLESRFLGVKQKEGAQYINITSPEDDKKVLTFAHGKAIGKGSFGVVFLAKIVDNGSSGSSTSGGTAGVSPGTTVAVKKVLQDRRFKNRELQIMQMLDHPNIVKLHNFYFSTNEKREVYLNMVLEYVPENLYQVMKSPTSMHPVQVVLASGSAGEEPRREGLPPSQQHVPGTVPLGLVKLYMFQCLRALAHIHSANICHRDIKPQNVLVNPRTGECKICDFGSAKQLVEGEPNISYICSRYYRAPELVFGATKYTCLVDVWSVGCVMAELLIGRPLFAGDSGVDQLVEIIKVLGTPTRDEINTMNPNYTEMKFPQVKGCSLKKLLSKTASPDAIDLLQQMLQYSPKKRISAAEALGHPCFNELHTNPAGLGLSQVPDIFNLIQGEADAFQPHIRIMFAERSKAGKS